MRTEKANSLIKLILLGLLAALFFSSTFVLNRAISLERGHWVWTGSLRYAWMLVLLSAWIYLRKGGGLLKETVVEFIRNWKFWLLAGTIGFGLFYAPLAFASAYAPGWVIASTWQFTIIATPIVLYFFGKKVPLKGIAFSLLIFLGIVMVNLEQAGQVGAKEMLLGILPVLLAAFAYPIGNQLVGEAKQGGRGLIPAVKSQAINDAPCRVMLLTLGSMPFWFILTLLAQPPAPLAGQVLNTGLVALFSGVIATSIFLYARHSSAKAYEIAAVDATQAGETVFSLLAEMAFLGAVLPGKFGFSGLIMIVAGIVFYVIFQTKATAEIAATNNKRVTAEA